MGCDRHISNWENTPLEEFSNGANSYNYCTVNFFIVHSCQLIGGCFFLICRLELIK